MKYAPFLLAILAIGMTLAFYPRLPEIVPTHWNIEGNIDAYAPKAWGAWFAPVLALFMALGFKVIPSLDPFKEKYKLFMREWQIIQVALIGFFVYLQGVIIYLSLYPEQDIRPFMFVGLGVLFIMLGNYLSKVRQNWFLGIKTPWTLASEENWNKTHRLASWWFVGAGVVTLLSALTGWGTGRVIFGVIMVAAMMPVLYSLLVFKKAEHLMKFVYVGVGVVFLAMLLW